MNHLMLMNLLEKKIFSPRKKIIFDSLGNKYFADSENWKEDMKCLSQKDRKLLEEGNGWNLADKEYVNFKIAEIYRNINSPSAPSLEINDTKNKSESSVNKNRFQYIDSVSEWKSGENKISFFYPGIVLRKGWVLHEISITSEQKIDDDFVLHIKNNFDDKILSSSKIKFNKNYTTVDIKFKTELPRSLYIEMLSNSDKKYQGYFRVQLVIHV